MAEAASLLVQRLKQEETQAKQPAASQIETAPAHKPIWEEIAELKERAGNNFPEFSQSRPSCGKVS